MQFLYFKTWHFCNVLIKADVYRPTVINIHASEATFKNESNSVQKKKKRFGILFNSMTDFYLFKVVSKSEFMFPLCVYTSQGF